MPRNSSGNYVLPAGNPVVPDTLIEAEWANPTLSDIAAALSDSLDRYGRGGMLAEFKVADGTVVSPGLSFTAQSSLGLYRSGIDTLAIGSSGETVARFSNLSIELLKGAAITGNATVSGTLAVNGAATFAGGSSFGGNVDTPGAASVGSLTVANPLITAGGVVGRIIPLGTILMWSGSVANIPAGFRLCDGTNGTPDLRNRFIIGAVNDVGGPATTTVTGGATKTGGSKDTVLVSHQHGGNTGTESAGHIHGGSTDWRGDHQHISGVPHDAGAFYGFAAPGGTQPGKGGTVTYSTSPWTNTTGGHAHDFSTGGASASHYHGFSTDWRGQDGANANLTPYYALAYIMCVG